VVWRLTPGVFPMHDDRERLEQYLAWRAVERKARRGRIYRRAGIAALVLLLLYGVTLAVVGHRWPRSSKGDRARVAAQSPRVTPARSSPQPEMPSLSTRETTSTDASAVAATPPVPVPKATAQPARSTTQPARVGTAPAATSRPRGSVSSAPGPATLSASSAASDQAPAASPRPDASTDSASTTPSPRGAPSTTTVVVEPPPAPMPTVIVEPPRTAAPVPSTPPAITAPNTLPATIMSAPPTVEQPGAVPGAPLGRKENLKRAIGYIPEVWVARKIAGWVKQQPVGELGTPPPERALPQAR